MYKYSISYYFIPITNMQNKNKITSHLPVNTID